MASVDLSAFLALEDYVARYGAGTGQVVDEVLHGEGALKAKRSIPEFIRPSGRRWRGKAPSMARNPAMGERLSQDDAPMQVTIAARGRYGYLYFPNDGSSTRRHAGGQAFMERGVQAAAPEVAEDIASALADAFGK